MRAGHNDERSDGCYGETEPQPPVGDAEVSLKRDLLREQSYEAEERHVDLHAAASGRGTLSEARGWWFSCQTARRLFKTLRRERVVVFLLGVSSLGMRSFGRLEALQTLCSLSGVTDGVA